MEGCTNEMACNYDEMANTDDGSCLLPGDACDDMDDNTVNDMYNDSACVGDSIVLGCMDTLGVTTHGCEWMTAHAISATSV